MNLRLKYIGLMVCVGLYMPVALAQRTITILHTNDTHSRIDPFSENQADTSLAGKAGYIRRATMVKLERRKDKRLLLFDSGDFSQGTPYYTLFKGDVEVKLMNEMKYTAATIGNHEFDFGLNNMARLFRMAKFPIVCANYQVSGTVLEHLVKPYVIIKRRGVRIGVFGLSPKLKGLVQEKNYEGVVFQDPVACANAIAAKLKKEKKCDIVICLSHLGWQGKSGDEHLVAHTRNIDIVLGGHSHSYIKKPVYYKNLDGLKIPVTQMGKNGRFVGKLILKMEKIRK